MTSWTAGYVADIGYTYGYYQELNPLRIQLAFANAGLVAPEVGTACELGFGQGLSTNLHAAASVTNWYGTDFNPSQAAFARELALNSGSGAQLFDQAFSEFCCRDDLPEFDFIGLHGIWSWISDENRRVIVDFVRRKLKVGGVLYISYNTLPGWAAFAPMRHLMTEHAEIIGSEGRGIVSRINDAIEFADRLLATNPIFSRANPLVSERIKKLKDQNRHYLAHEYFNRDWHPMHFSTMAQWLEPSKVQFACSAHYIDQIDQVNLSAEQQHFLKEIPDEMFKQSVRDFMVNQQFRKDYWVKGARKMTSLEQAEALRSHRILLVSHRADVQMKVTGALGEANLNESIYGPILDLLSDHKPRSLGEIESKLRTTLTFPQIIQASLVLSGIGHLQPVQSDALIMKSKSSVDKANRYLIEKAKGSNEIVYLASPVTGGGIAVNRFQQLFLLAIQNGQKRATDWAEFAWTLLREQGQRLIKDGKAIETHEENLRELTAQAHEFERKVLPILKALSIS